MNAEFLNCSYASLCSGCDWLQKPATEQRALKEEALRLAWLEAGIGDRLPGRVRSITPVLGGSRDRVDLMIDRRSGSYRLGLFDRFRTGIVDLQGCPQLSPKLEAWLQEFRKFEFPIERGSVRLRVAPDGTKGVWLDFANIDIKKLLNERTLLDRLREIAVVEIGQKKKRLIERDGNLKLDDPSLLPWFETYAQNQTIPLYSVIGGFTQPGFEVNKALVGEVARIVTTEKIKHAAEFGSGIGNFTLPLARLAERVDAYEVDALALEGLKRTLIEQGLESKVQIHSGNYQGDKAAALDFAGVDLLLVDPPRSGLMKFLDPIAAMHKASRPNRLLYISCFAESFAQDAKRLFDIGYELREMSIVDQFPQSRHFETIALFTLPLES